jgi:hypothetical protein
MTPTDPAQPLKEFQPRTEFFVGIDSDGCAFDTMGIKHRECFCPWMIGCFGLQPVAQAARECKEFADLFSKTRGANRHKTLKRILAELLPSHPTVKIRKFGPQLPTTSRGWTTQTACSATRASNGDRHIGRQKSDRRSNGASGSTGPSRRSSERAALPVCAGEPEKVQGKADDRVSATPATSPGVG